MGLRAYKSLTAAEYLQIDDESAEKYEFLNGEIVAMAGTSINHNFIFMNLAWHLRNSLSESGCNVLGADIRVATPFFNSYMYPDVIIVCGELERPENDNNTLMNPSVLIEILSPSTRDKDMGEKLLKYLQIPSLQEYILVDSAATWCKMISRNTNDNWKITESTGLSGTLQIESLHLSVPLADVYRNVVFDDK